MASKNVPERRSGTERRGFLSNPWSELHREVDRLFDDFMGDLRPWRSRGGLWGDSGGELAPRVDVSETDKEIQIRADLPGIDEKDIDVTLSNGVLTIRGERKAEKEEKDEKKSYHRVERSWGLYTRSIPLPADVEEDKVQANFSRGVLTIAMPKSEPASSNVKKISVKSA